MPMCPIKLDAFLFEAHVVIDYYLKIPNKASI